MSVHLHHNTVHLKVTFVDMGEKAGSVGDVTFGCFVALVGGFCAGSSMVLQKVGVARSSRRIWLLGLVLLIVGEALTVVAYTYAPAVLVSPLGAVRVIVTTLLSTSLLGERLTNQGKFGILVSTLGSLLVVYNAPKHNTIATFAALDASLTTHAFEAFFLLSSLVVLYLVVFVAPTHGSSNLFVFVSITNIIGAFGVLLSKGIGIVIGSILQGNLNYIFEPTTWFVCVGEVVGAVSQLYYLNMALKHFDAAVVAPLKYVGTNILVVIGSCILYQEFSTLTFKYVLYVRNDRTDDFASPLTFWKVNFH